MTASILRSPPTRPRITIPEIDLDIRITADSAFNKAARAIADSDCTSIKNVAFIYNNTSQTVRFSVYDANNPFLIAALSWFPVQTTDAQPNETVKVQPKVSTTMKVSVKGHSTYFNVKKKTLYVWDGKYMRDLLYDSSTEKHASRIYPYPAISKKSLFVILIIAAIAFLVVMLG